MIFIDSNIPMYLVGADHPNKLRTVALLERLIESGTRLVTSAEVLQEILHRYVAIDRRDAIQPAMDALIAITDEIFSIDAEQVNVAKTIVLERPRISARDALHLAVMRAHDVTQIASFDTGFDSVPAITRLPSA